MNLSNTLPDSMRGLSASFFKGPWPTFNENNLTKLQEFYTVSHLDLDWGDRSPGTDIPNDNFSAIFEGKLIADTAGTQDYTLYLNTANDEGVRLFIGNKKLIDTWDSPKSGELKAKVSLTGSKPEDIRVMYKDGTGDAKLKLEWESDGLERQVIPRENFARHGYGAVNESDLLTIHVAKNGSNDFQLIENPTPADYSAIRGHTFASIQDAVDQAEALMNTGQGVKILIQPGTYRVSEYDNFGIIVGHVVARESEQFKLNNQGRQATLVIEGAAPGVRILGSQQWKTGWQHVGNNVYKHEWTEDWGFETGMPSNPPLDPLLHRREAVFVNGERLEPTLFRETTYRKSSNSYAFGKKMNPVKDLRTNQFTVDEDGDAIYIKLPPGVTTKDRKIEVAQAEQLLRAHEPNDNLVLRNLNFAHAANRYVRDYAFGAIDIGSDEVLPDSERSRNIVLDNVQVRDNSGSGLRLRRSDDITVRHSDFSDNGALGISTTDVSGLVLHDLDIKRNNWLGDLGDYRGWFVGGVKHHFIEDVTADTVDASNNYAHGYWYDLNSKNTAFINGTTNGNSENGVFIEVSDGPHQVINSVSRNNGLSGVMVNTSPHVFLQGNDFANNAQAASVEGLESSIELREGEVRFGARTDREASSPNLPDIVDNTTLIDNVIQNTTNNTVNELVALTADIDRYRDWLENELEANHNVYWDRTGEPAFARRYNKNVEFSEPDKQGERWIDVSNREDFEAGSVFERPKTGNAKPSYTGTFTATLGKGKDTILTANQLAVNDPDTYDFDLIYTLTTVPKQGNLRLRGVRLEQGDTFRLTDVKRNWVSYTHESSNQIDDTLRLQISDGVNTLAAKRLALTIGSKDTSAAATVEPTIFVNSGNVVKGNAFQAEKQYQGSLFSNTDSEFKSGKSPRDIISGTKDSDDIWAGLQGADQIEAGAGNDTIGIGLGNVTVDAGAGNDFVYGLGAGGGNNTVDLGFGNDNFWAKGGNNNITGSGRNSIGLGAGNDTVNTSTGNDSVYSVNGGGGTNILNLGNGNNSVYVEKGKYTITTGSGDDLIGLGSGTDEVNAGNGNNIIYMVASGGTSAGSKDVLTGTGDDSIETGSGKDLIDAGTGLNTIFGGGGKDTFIIREGAYNFLGDFERGKDKIGLTGIQFNELSFFQGIGALKKDVFIFADNEAIAQVADTTVAQIDNSTHFVTV